MRPCTPVPIVLSLIGGTVLGGCTITPTPLDDATLQNQAQINLSQVTANQEPIHGSIGLYDAMARALKYNLDYQVEIFQRSLRVRELNLSRYDMLPTIVANSGFVNRNNYSASTSRIVNFDDSLGPPGAFRNFNTSQERRQRLADIELSWNVLDFGLSYVRALQSADLVLIAEETRRKVINRVIEDVRTAYWRAVTADRLAKRLSALEGRTRAALRNTRSLSAEGQASPITALTYERELVEIKQTIYELKRELSVAKSQLAALMNIAPGTHFQLKYPSHLNGHLALPANTANMLWTAMNSRPELREIAYRRRINLHEADAALLQLLPGLNLYANTNYDSNDYLLHGDWLSWGAKATWNLLKIVQYPARREVLNAQDELLEKRELALTMAIMTQVHVSRVRFKNYQRELESANEYLGVQKRLVGKMRVEAGAGRISEQTIIREEMNTLVAELKRDIAHAGLQNAYANVYAAMGIDLYGDEVDADLSVDTLANRLRVVIIERTKDVRAGRIMTVASK